MVQTGLGGPVIGGMVALWLQSCMCDNVDGFRVWVSHPLYDVLVSIPWGNQATASSAVALRLSAASLMQVCGLGQTPVRGGSCQCGCDMLDTASYACVQCVYV